jgi:hypothetical protein
MASCAILHLLRLIRSFPLTLLLERCPLFPGPILSETGELRSQGQDGICESMLIPIPPLPSSLWQVGRAQENLH